MVCRKTNKENFTPAKFDVGDILNARLAIYNRANFGNESVNIRDILAEWRTDIARWTLRLNP